LSRTNVKWNNARTEYFRPQRGIRHDLQYVNIYRFTHHYKVQMFTFKPLPIDQKLCFSSIGHMFTIAFRRWESWFLAIMSSCSVVLRYLPHKISLPKSWKTVCNFLHSLRIQVLFITSNFLNSNTMFVLIDLWEREINKREIAKKLSISLVWMKREIRRERSFLGGSYRKTNLSSISKICELKEWKDAIFPQCHSPYFLNFKFDE
jgi:hypothetical protein